jgi:DNA mismatch repair protein MutH
MWINKKGEFAERERTPLEFKAVAADIFDQYTAAEDKPLREYWESLADLRIDQGDPFKEGSDVEIFYMTRAKS